MLTENQKSHIQKHYRVFLKLLKDLESIDKEIASLKDKYETFDDFEDETYLYDGYTHIQGGYSNKYRFEQLGWDYCYLEKMKIKRNEQEKFIEPLQNVFDKKVECKKRIEDLEKDFFDYLKKNNIDFADTTIEETDYNIIHGITY
jgi:hypothetical protein